MILTVLTGIGLAFTVLGFIGILAVIIGILRDNIGDGLTKTGETFVYRVLPVTVFVLFTFGTVLVEVGTDPENRYQACLETVKEKDYCFDKYLTGKNFEEQTFIQRQKAARRQNSRPY